MRRSPEAEYVIARYQRAVALGLSVADEVKLLAEWLGSNPKAILAILYRAGILGKAQPLYHTDAEIAEEYRRNPSMTRISETLGVSFYAVRAALYRQGIQPLGNHRPRPHTRSGNEQARRPRR